MCDKDNEADDNSLACLELTLTEKNDLLKATNAEQEANNAKNIAILAEIEAIKAETAALKAEIAARDAKTNLYGLLLREDLGIELHCDGPDSSCQSRKFPPVKIRKSNMFQLENIPVDKMKGLKDLLRSHGSMMLALSNQSQPLTYSNETEVRGFVRAAIDDAVGIVNYCLKATLSHDDSEMLFLQTRFELSMFCNKPDHLFVYYGNADHISTVMVILIKKPGEKVMDDSDLQNQLADYMLSQSILSGSTVPIGVLSTFEQTCVMWMEPFQQETKEKLNRVLEKPLFRFCDETLRNFGNCVKTPCLDSSEEKINRTHSCPPGLLERIDSRSNSSASRDLNSQTTFYMTKTFEQKDIVVLLSNAIICAMHGAVSSKCSSTVITKDFLLKQNAIRLTSADYHWAAIDMKNDGIATEQLHKSGDSSFYIVGYVGMGYTAKIFRAVLGSNENNTSKCCYDCVIKMFCNRYDKYTKEYNDERTYDEQCEEQAQNEVERYKEFYPELEGKIWATKLNNLHCIIMPYFTPIPNDDRKKYLSEIGNVLRTTFCKNSISSNKRHKDNNDSYDTKKSYYYSYNESDRSWRHVGCFNNTIYLFDLGDLEQHDCGDDNDDNTAKEKYILDHITRLENRMY